MLDLVLVNAPSPQLEDDCMAPPIGLIELATHVSNLGHEVRVIDAAGGVDFDAQVERARVYGFTVQSTQYTWVIEAISRLRARFPDTVFVVGGHHTSALPEDTLRDTRADFAVVGDGEHALVKILSGEAERGVITGAEANVNHENSPNYDFVDFTKYNRRINGSKAMTVMASRSCPYRCHFCAKMPGSRFRYRDARLVLKDVDYLRNTYKISAVHFHDDNLLFPRKRAEILARGLRERGITWRCLTRADSVFDDEDFVRLVKDCGCHEVCFGIESGSDKILKLLNKGTTVEQNKRAVQLCRKIGLSVDVYLMINVPGETLEDIELTKKFIVETRPTNWVLNSFIPTVGSRMWNNPEEFGFKITSKDFAQFHSCGKHGRGGIVSESNWTAEELYEIREDMLSFLRENVKMQYT